MIYGVFGRIKRKSTNYTAITLLYPTDVSIIIHRAENIVVINPEILFASLMGSRRSKVLVGNL